MNVGLHILIGSAAYHPLPGGGERYVRSLAHELVAQGCRVTVLTSSAETEADFWNGTSTHETVHDGQITVIRLPVRKMVGGRSGLLAWRKAMVTLSMATNAVRPLQWMSRQIPSISRINETLSTINKPDVIHLFNISWESPMIQVASWATGQNIPVITTPFAHFGDNPKSRVALNSMMAHQRHLLAESAAVLTLTSVEEIGFNAWGVYPDVTVIGGGVDRLPSIVPDANPLVPLDGRYCLFLGRATIDKGAIDTMKACLERGRPLLMAGQSAPEFETFYNSLTTSQKKQITHCGIVSEAMKHALLATCEMLILPSHSDSFGIVFLEAWAYGKPVIGANSGGIPGVVDDRKTGLLVPYGDVQALGDAIDWLWNDEIFATRLGQAGQAQLATRFSWSAVAQKCIDVYSRVL